MNMPDIATSSLARSMKTFNGLIVYITFSISKELDLNKNGLMIFFVSDIIINCAMFEARLMMIASIIVSIFLNPFQTCFTKRKHIFHSIPASVVSTLPLINLCFL